MRVAPASRIFVDLPDQAEKQRAVTLARLQGEQAHFQRPGSRALQNLRVGQPAGNGKGRTIMGADHANDSPIAKHDPVGILVVELVYQNARARVRVLWDLSHKRAIIEPMNLIEFFLGVCLLEDVVTDAQHPGPPPPVQGGRPCWGPVPPGARRCAVCPRAERTNPGPSLQALAAKDGEISRKA